MTYLENTQTKIFAINYSSGISQLELRIELFSCIQYIWSKMWRQVESSEQGHQYCCPNNDSDKTKKETMTQNTCTKKSNKKAVLSQDDRAMRAISGSKSNEPLRRYDHSKLSKMAACRQLGFDVTGNSAIRSADPEKPTLEPNMKCIGWPVAQIWPFAYIGAYGTPILGGRGGRRGLAMTIAPSAEFFFIQFRLAK